MSTTPTTETLTMSSVLWNFMEKGHHAPNDTCGDHLNAFLFSVGRTCSPDMAHQEIVHLIFQHVNLMAATDTSWCENLLQMPDNWCVIKLQCVPQVCLAGPPNMNLKEHFLAPAHILSSELTNVRATFELHLENIRALSQRDPTKNRLRGQKDRNRRWITRDEKPDKTSTKTRSNRVDRKFLSDRKH